jgi:hypothetical protein
MSHKSERNDKDYTLKVVMQKRALERELQEEMDEIRMEMRKHR